MTSVFATSNGAGDPQVSRLLDDIMQQYVFEPATSTDTLRAGYAVCLDTTQSTAALKTLKVCKPTLANIHLFVGVVAEQSDGATTGTVIKVIPPDYILPGITVRTNDNVAAGDILGPAPGTYYLKHYVGFTRPVCVANEAQDRRTTAGTVNVNFGFNAVEPEHLTLKFFKYDNHFVTRPNISTTADIAEFLWTVTQAGASSGLITIADAKAGGYLRSLTDDADNDTNALQLNGEPFKLDKSCLFKIENFSLGDADKQDFFIGLATTDTDVLTGTTDSIGFRMVMDVDGEPIYYIAEKATTETTATTGTTPADATEYDLYFWYDADQDAIHFYVNGTEVTQPVATNVPDTNPLTLTIEHRNYGAQVNNLYIDRIFIGNQR